MNGIRPCDTKEFKFPVLHSAVSALGAGLGSATQTGL